MQRLVRVGRVHAERGAGDAAVPEQLQAPGDERAGETTLPPRSPGEHGVAPADANALVIRSDPVEHGAGDLVAIEGHDPQADVRVRIFDDLAVARLHLLSRDTIDL